MTAQIIHLRSDGDHLRSDGDHLRSDGDYHLPGRVRTEADIGMLAAARFMSACPKCKDLRSQDGLGSRTLLRLLTGDHPIEAYCVVCDEFWPISAAERQALAKRLER